MMTNKINIAVSKNDYTKKPSNGEFTQCEFMYKELNRDELLSEILKGKIMAHNFTVRRWANKEERTFKRFLNQRDYNFEYANVLFVDVDDTDLGFNEFIDSLTMKPTIAYTTFSHIEKGNRYRLVYVLTDKVTHEEEYSMLVYSSVIYFRTIHPGFMIDLHSLYCVQPMYGTKSNALTYVSDFVYSKNDFLKYYDYDLSEHIHDEWNEIEREKKEAKKLEEAMTNGTEIAPKEEKETKKTNVKKKKTKKEANHRRSSSEYEINDKEFIDDFFSTDLYDEVHLNAFIYKYRNIYPYFDETPLTAPSDQMVIIIPDDPRKYQKIHREYITNSFKDVNGNKVTRKEIKKIRIGERTHRMYVDSQLRKVMVDNVTPEHLLYCLVVDFKNAYDTSDKEIDNKKLYQAAFNAYYDDMLLNLKKDKREFIVNIAYCQKYGKDKRTVANEYRTIKKDEEIAKLYDFNLSVKENLRILKENKVDVCQSRLYEFYNKYKTDKKEEEAEEFVFEVGKPIKNSTNTISKKVKSNFVSRKKKSGYLYGLHPNEDVYNIAYSNDYEQIISVHPVYQDYNMLL